MTTCPLCGVSTVTAPHVYCSVRCRRQDLANASTLRGMLAEPDGAYWPPIPADAVEQIAAADARAASVAPTTDGSEPY